MIGFFFSLLASIQDNKARISKKIEMKMLLLIGARSRAVCVV